MFLQLFIDIEGGLKKALAKWGLRKLQVCCFLAVSFHVSVRASINKNQSLAVYCDFPGNECSVLFWWKLWLPSLIFTVVKGCTKGVTRTQRKERGGVGRQKSCLSPTSSIIHSYTKSNLVSQISDYDLVMLSHPNKISPCRLIVIMPS